VNPDKEILQVLELKQFYLRYARFCNPEDEVICLDPAFW